VTPLRSQTDPSVGGRNGPSEIQPTRILRSPHPGRWISGLVLLVLCAMVVHALVFAHVTRAGKPDSRFQWDIVWHYFASSQVLSGLLVTLELTVIAMAIGIVGGVLLAVMRSSPNFIARWVAGIYVWFFRGTPVLVQLLFWFNLSYVFPQLSIGVPFGPAFVNLQPNSLITPFVAAIVGLGLNEAAYMSEIVRAGLLAIDEGQVEAASALGMSRLLAMRRVVLPQAMRVIIPPTGNQVISMLKTSSLASVITVTELLYSAQLIYARTYQTIPLLVTASIWYLMVSTILSVGQHYVERRFGRGASRGTNSRTLREALTELKERAASFGVATSQSPAGPRAER
jgi:polar amino acid transport system permease protein